MKCIIVGMKGIEIPKESVEDRIKQKIWVLQISHLAEH